MHHYHELGTERAISLIQVCVCVELLKRSQTCTHVTSAVPIYLFIYLFLLCRSIYLLIYVFAVLWIYGT